MAFDSIVAYVILFSLGISAAVGIAFFYKDYLVKTTSSLESRQDILESKGNSGLDFINVSYFPPSSRTHNITTMQDFSEGIFEGTNDTINPGSLNLEWNGTNYSSIGNWSSPIINLGHRANLSAIAFNYDMTGSAWLGIQIRSAENASLLIGEFLGPDGTTGSYYESSQELGNFHHDHEVFQLRVYLNTSNTSISPELEDVSIIYSYTYNDVEINIENSGKIKLDPAFLDIFIGNERIPRDYAGLSSEVVSSSEIMNPDMWDPEEILKITFPYNFSESKIIIRAVNEFSSSDYMVYDNS
ncbi:MAG: hypothetical protein ACLFPQ_01170 [Candidatus Woesearchaeota archaeon]